MSEKYNFVLVVFFPAMFALATCMVTHRLVIQSA